ncbi:interferon regulatory factor 10 isoform X1 [Synchiropus splendidus]|uniref:interferon regulatory factor 10 isoform X1 n=1 Tax=Synchiropus splendidus TaxID=270530 RepID=UPI00237E5C95|nr:interferon regulatory factor 10 isoform X1 [Synchiropus splendidus]
MDDGAKMHLRDWLVAQVDSGRFEGLCWDDDGKTMFRIPWKHAAKKDYNQSEDAALFKAWAVYKGKYREGKDEANPSMWKTRLRCALNKSTEFQEVPERNQLDITEPYKVYRILRDGDQDTERGSSGPINEVQRRRLQQKLVCQENQDDSSPMSGETDNTSMDNPLREHMYCFSRGANTRKQSPSLSTLRIAFTESDCRMRVTLLYHGISVTRVVTSSPEGCFILQGSATVGNEEIYGRCTTQQISFPSPDRLPLSKHMRDAMTLLLGHLRKGVLLWVAPDGVFIKRFCQVRVYWSGPAAKHTDKPNKLDREKTFKLLDTQTFLTELHNFSHGNGPPPSYEIDLCFGEEYPDPKIAKTEKLIMARQVVPLFAEELARRLNLEEGGKKRRTEVISTDGESL